MTEQLKPCPFSGSDDERITALTQTIESQKQTAKAMAKRLENQAAEIEELREALEALLVTQNGPQLGHMIYKIKWQDAMRKARAAIIEDLLKEKTK